MMRSTPSVEYVTATAASTSRDSPKMGANEPLRYRKKSPDTAEATASPQSDRPAEPQRARSTGRLRLHGRPGATGRSPQPQRSMGGLHGFPHDRHQGIVQLIEVGLVPERCAESLQGPGRVVLPPVETPVYEALDTATQRVEQRGYSQRGGHHCEL